MAGYPKAVLAGMPPKASPPAPRRLASTLSLQAHPPATPGSHAPTLPDTTEETPQTPEESPRRDTPPIEVEDKTPVKQLPDNQQGDSQLYPQTPRDEKEAENQAPQSPRDEKEAENQAPQSHKDEDAKSEKSLPATIHFPNPDSPVPSPSSMAWDQSPTKSEEQMTPKTPPCEEETASKNTEKKNTEKKKRKQSELPDEYKDGSYWKILGLDSKTRK